MIIKSKPKIAQLNVGRNRNDDVSFVIVYAENDTPASLSDKDVKLIFEDLRTGSTYLTKTPSQFDGNKAIISLTAADKTQIKPEVAGISLQVEGVTLAKGNFTWSAEYAAQSANPEAIGINYRTLDETVEWFEVVVGPYGKTAYVYAVEYGYTGTEEEFGYAMADLPHARDEAEAARDEAVEAKNQAVSARDEAVLAADTSTEAKEDALLAKAAAESARDIAISAKEDAEDARDEAVPAASVATEAKEDAESARDIAVNAKGDALLAQSAAESARDTAVGARNEAVDARNEAVPAASAATSAKDDAEDARDIAVSAKDDAEEASNVAIQAKDDAELAAQAAEEDRDEAEQFRDQAEGYRDESEQFRDEAEYFAYLTGLGSPLWYGVQWDVTVAATELTRIGNMDMHRELPIQNNRFGCVLKDDGTINYKLHPNNWAYQYNGQPSIRDGTDGQVGIRQNEYWVRPEMEGNIRRIKLSPFALPGYFRVPPYFRGAYEATVYRPENKLASVANNTPDYRGGNNNAAWDSDDRSLLGVPASNISRPDFQTYARNRGTGWEMEPWYIYLLEWHLYLVEYANRNCQLPFTPSLTAEGFRQGGLGEGVTNINSTAWNNWKSQYGFVPCGYTDEFGVYTGIKSLQLPAGYGSELSTSVPRWRGIENPFGHLWKWVNGINILVQADSDGGKSYAYRSDNPANWSDSSNVDYRLVGEVAREQNYMTDVVFGEGGDLIPSQTGGSSSTFWADRWYTAVPSSGVAIRGLRVGGASNSGAAAGFGCLYSPSALSYAYASLGSRLCFLPEHPLLIS